MNIILIHLIATKSSLGDVTPKSMLIFFRPKKICDRSLALTQKNTECVNFQPKKIRQNPRHVYFEYPPGLTSSLGFTLHVMFEIQCQIVLA